MGRQMLRCADPSLPLRFAQDDRAVTHANVWINLFICIIAPRSRPYTSVGSAKNSYIGVNESRCAGMLSNE
jgi:hypothetical protein